MLTIKGSPAPACLIFLPTPLSGLHINWGGWLEQAKTAGVQGWNTRPLQLTLLQLKKVLFQIHASFPQWSAGTNGFEKSIKADNYTNMWKINELVWRQLLPRAS